MRTEHHGEGHVHAQDAAFEGACPTCDGTLHARLTVAGVWAWCGACRRLSHPTMMLGPAGPTFMHPAAAA